MHCPTLLCIYTVYHTVKLANWSKPPYKGYNVPACMTYTGYKYKVLVQVHCCMLLYCYTAILLLYRLPVHSTNTASVVCETQGQEGLHSGLIACTRYCKRNPFLDELSPWLKSTTALHSRRCSEEQEIQPLNLQFLLLQTVMEVSSSAFHRFEVRTRIVLKEFPV